MTPTNWLWDLLAWLSLPLLALLAGVLVWRKRQRDYPFFFAYVFVALLAGVVRFVVYKAYSPRVYFYVFWWSDFIGVLAAFLAIYETFLRRIFPSFANVRFYRYLFPAAAAMIALLAFLTALHAPDKRTAFFVTSRVFDFVRSAVIGFFVAVILFMGRQFKGYEFSIAAGFGIQAAVALANAAIRTQTHDAATALDRFEPVAFDASCLIWLWSFAQKSKTPPSSASETLTPEALQEAKKWESKLKGFVNRGKG